MLYTYLVDFNSAIKKAGIVEFANTEIGRVPQARRGWEDREEQGRKQRKVYFKMPRMHSMHS